MNPPRTYLSYLLRLWRSDEHTPWRASLEDARTHEQHAFAVPDRLFAFLNDQMQVDGHREEIESSTEDQTIPGAP